MSNGAKRILLAAPRGWCAGVDRAVEIVEAALARYGPPVYVRHQIVHNQRVVGDLEAKGAVFVECEDEVPTGSVCVLSAHGVAPTVRDNARRRGLQVIDATCPLVAKVHGEARRLAQADKTIVLIGHAAHEEVEGTCGEAPEHIVVVEGAQDADAVAVSDPSAVAYLTQTTLSVDDTADIVEVLRRRLPAITGPSRDDICYASQNRQRAVKAIAARSDTVLVVGADNSSNANRLVEVARDADVPAWLIPDAGAIDEAWIADADVVGVSSAASTPEILVEEVLSFLGERGYRQVEEVRVAVEDVRFALPAGLDRRRVTGR